MRVRFPIVFSRIVLAGLLAFCLPLVARAQSRPDIQWMRGAINGSVRQIALSPDGLSVAMGGTDGTTKIRRISDGMLLETLVESSTSGTPVTVNTLAYTPDGTKIVTGNNTPEVHIWDLASNTILKVISAPNTVNSVAVSPDGKTLAVGTSSNDILLFNLSDYSSAGILGGHSGSVRSVAFSPDSQKLASGSADSTVRIWQISNATLLKTLNDGNSVGSVAFADSTIVCSGNTAGKINIWNATAGTLLRTITGTASFGNQSVALAISQDGTRVTAGFAQSDTKLRTWRISDATLLLTADTTFPVISIAYPKDSAVAQVYCSDAANHVTIWNSTNLGQIGALAVPFANSVKATAFSPGGALLATGSYDGLVKFWNPITGVLLSTIAPVFGSTAATQINALAFSPDGTQIAIAGLSNNTGILWIYQPDGTFVRSVTVTATSLAYSPDGTMLAAGVGSNVNRYLTANMAAQPALTGHTSTVNAVAIAPNSSLLASASSDGTVKLWNLATGVLARTLSQHTGSVFCVSFSPDSLSLVDGSSDKKSILWRAEDGAILQTFTDTETIQTAVISRDGKQVATGGVDRHLKIWDVTSATGVLFDYTLETGAPTSSFSGLQNGVMCLAYSPDGKSIAYGRNDATVVVAANPLFVPLITGLTLNPSLTVGGNVVTGTVTLNSIAGGAVITLSTDHPEFASLPMTMITVPQNSDTATFMINTSGVTAQSTANIKASLNGSEATAVLTVTTPNASGLTLVPSTVRGGQISIGTVTLTGAAPAGGVVVPLSSSSTKATVPASVTVLAGMLSANFNVVTEVVSQQTTATITATLGSAVNATLTITPPTVTALSIAPANLRGGTPATGTVTISDPAPTGGISVSLSSNNSVVATSNANSVTVAAGSTTATFDITTHPVSTTTGVMFTASFNGSSKTATLTVTPPLVNSLNLNPTSVKGSKTSTGTVTISDPAPPGGQPVNLSSANTAVATVPPSVTVPAGSSTVTFTVNTSPVATDTQVVLTATIGTSTVTGTLTVQAPALSGFALNPTNVHSFVPSTGVLTLDAPAPAGGTKVTLTSPDPSKASMPANATVPQGSTTVTFPITTGNVTTYTSLFLSATLGSVTKTAELVIVPRVPFDFDGDGKNDLFYQLTTNGQGVAWFMNGLTVRGGSSLSQAPPAGWQIVGVGDFDNDGHPDIVIQNTANGKVAIWYLVGTNVREGSSTSIPPAAEYKIVGVGDFNNDGHPDLLFQNQFNGQLTVWYLNGPTVIGSASITTQPAANYQVVGVGDFNNDGHLDIVMQSSVTNQIVVWYMNGTTFIGGGFTSSTPASPWTVKGVADYNGDGMPDLVFQNGTTTQVFTWFMNGLTVTGGDLISIQPPNTYRVVGPH